MGWTSKYADYFKDGTVDRKTECDKLYTCEETEKYNQFRVVKSVMYGTKYYAVVEISSKRKDLVYRRPVVVLTSVQSKNNGSFCEFFYKEIYSPELPNNLLDLLPNDSYNIKYKQECIEAKLRENKRKNESGKTQLSKLPVGSIIKFQSRYSDKTIELIKRDPDYQFKKTWWQYLGELKYYNKKYIPDNYEIIRIGYEKRETE